MIAKKKEKGCVNAVIYDDGDAGSMVESNRIELNGIKQRMKMRMRMRTSIRIEISIEIAIETPELTLTELKLYKTTI